MLIYGVANPAGEHGNYNGLYLKDAEIDEMVKKGTLRNKPVKIEHRGVNIGSIVSAFKDDKKQLVCVIEINDNELEGAIAQEWIKDNTIKELSLGYTVDIDKKDDRLKAMGKNVVEVSLVKKGARENCHIYGNDAEDERMKRRKIEHTEQQQIQEVNQETKQEIQQETRQEKDIPRDWQEFFKI